MSGDYITPTPVITPEHRAKLEHLKILGICHYVVAGLHVLQSLYGVFYFVIGAARVMAPPQRGGEDSKVVDVVFMAIAGVIVLLYWILAALTIYSGLCVRGQRRRLFSLVVGGFNCFLFPVGTALGVFTFILLLNDQVREIYEMRALADNSASGGGY